MKTHYSRAGDYAACNVRGIPAERLTADLDTVDCGNCLSSRPWRSDISQRDYREQYERFHGPGGFLDRAGQTTPMTATTAPQSLAALARSVTEELERAARRGREGAGSDALAAIVRDSARVIMAGAESVIRLALAESGTAAAVTRTAATLTADPAVECAAYVPDPDDEEGPVTDCGKMSRFQVARSDGDTSYGINGGSEEACAEHLADAVCGMLEGDVSLHAIVSVRWDRGDDDAG